MTTSVMCPYGEGERVVVGGGKGRRELVEGGNSSRGGRERGREGRSSFLTRPPGVLLWAALRGLLVLGCSPSAVRPRGRWVDVGSD